MTGPPSDPSFEDALSALEDIVRKLESGDVALDRSIALFEEGNRLRVLCQQRLDAARLKIEAIAAGSAEAGRVTTRPFDPD